MTTIRKLPYKVDDYLWIVDHEEVWGERQEHAKWAEAHACMGESLTFWIGEKVAAVGGFTPIWGHSAEMWVFIAPSCKHIASVIVNLKEQMNDWAKTYRLARVQAVCVAADRTECRFLEWMGMDFEGTLRKYGPQGMDFAMYAKVYPWQ